MGILGVIDDFVSEYERQYDFWDASARMARDLLEAELSSSGLRAIVTSRAKSVDRLVEKLRQRDQETPYSSVAQISGDIADRAGVRVALYFPGQMDEVERVIKGTLDVRNARRFPDGETANAGSRASERKATSDAAAMASGPFAHRPRFSGYGARHYRVLIPDMRLSPGQERYASALIEIQVASVLMHAWSEVEHDLIYKPLEGALSPSEYALLDQLNGLVLAGEIALEQVQKAGDARVAAAETPFRNHYELAEFLRTRLLAFGIDLTDATLGRVDLLFDYLAQQGTATASTVGTYLDLLERDFERRPVAAQLADLMLSGDESRYDAYLRAMSASRQPSNRRRTTIGSLRAGSVDRLALGEFVVAWVLLETLLKNLGKPDDGRPPPLPAQLRRLAEQGLITPEQLVELNLARDLRNQVLHGNAAEVSSQRLTEAAALLRDLTAAIHRNTNGS